jgi:hypothetical protein
VCDGTLEKGECVAACCVAAAAGQNDPVPFDEEHDPEQTSQTGARKDSADGAAPRGGWEQTELQKTAGFESGNCVCRAPSLWPAQVLDAF